ncbi:MAG: phage tail tube protein [Clostridium sp.]|uniref:phage tail tube protein n=1 Tax=Clostridium sp. TaxID=1506 RepID=UPI0029041D56|nr:phage tail tube protein [Clostridium sp.]MDU2680470.1 phage tail tube protein [Clostridium sp.]
MLANGIKLGYKKKGAEPATYTDLQGLKEVPEMGDEPEKVDNTCLSDKVKQYEYGIGDPGDLEFKFKYENSSATSPYRVLRAAAESKEVLSFEETFPDGTKFNWDAQVSVKLGGGGVNGVIEFTLKMALQSDIRVVDPI